MWRSFFLAVGIMLVILGVESLMIDSANLYAAKDSSPTEFIDPTAAPSENWRVIKPAEWMPWTFFSSGAITIIYAITLPARWKNEG